MPEPAELARKPAEPAAQNPPPGTTANARSEMLSARPAVQRLDALRNHVATPLRGPRPVQRAGAAPVQLARIAVGFDRVSEAADPAADSLVTTGLANCIAVAAQDRNSQRAVMGHFNTGLVADNEGAFDQAAFIGFRRLLEAALRRVAGAAIDPVFHVALGRIWLSENRDVDAAENRGWWNMRFSLIRLCQAVFGTEPTEGGASAEFTLSNGTLAGSGALGQEQEAVAAPANDPHGTAGDGISYERLRRGNPRGHKLDRDMTLTDRLSVALNPDG